MRVSSCFNGGPGRTRTYDQGIMSPGPSGFTPFQPVTRHRHKRLILHGNTLYFPVSSRILLTRPVLVPRGTPGAIQGFRHADHDPHGQALRTGAPAANGTHRVFDRTLPGFCLRVSEKGRKSFCLLYRVNGIKRRLTIGPYTGAGSLKAARDRARKALMAAAEGRDPATEKTEARRKGDTVGEVVEDYWRLHLAGLKDGSKARRILDQEVVARWRYRRIGQITRRDIIALVDEVAGRGTTGHADKVRAWVHALMNWCLSRDLIEANPAAALRRPHKTRIRLRVLGDEELAPDLEGRRRARVSLRARSATSHTHRPAPRRGLPHALARR